MVPTEIGKITLDFLEKNFENIVNYDFTNNMEKSLDIIVSGNLEWTKAIGDFYSLFHPNVEKLSSTVSQKSENNKKRTIGTSENGKIVYTYIAKYGPVIQIGDDKDKDKKYIKLDDKFNVETVTYKDIELLITFPKNLGKYKDFDILIKNGRYGYYIVYNGKNYKILPDFNELLTLEEAIQCIENNSQNLNSEKSNNDGESNVNVNVKIIGEYNIKIGKYGPYILFNGKFYKINNQYEPKDLTEEDCKKIVGENSTTKKKAYTKK
jgi:DNA topoisomerase-1